AKFCTGCGASLSNSSSSSTSEVEQDTTPRVVESLESSTYDPIPVPAKALSQLVDRGKQLALEKRYTGKQDGDEKLIKRISEAEKDGGYPLEEIVDTYIQERGEQERLEGLLESGEVTERVYSRLSKEYDEKLLDLEEQIREGRVTLLGYLTTLRNDLTEAEEELDTIEARIKVDDEEDLKGKQKKLIKKIQKLQLAVTAAVHILNKESAISGGAPIRFEISERTLGEPATEEPESGDQDSPTSSPEKAESGSPKEPASDIEGGKICPKCGVVTKPEAKFCTRCGQKI
ncbi:MAG: zinc-ribbon domain-containing protein, partial [Promethearchaeota archaeon]